MTDPQSTNDRLRALEQQLAALTSEMAALRAELGHARRDAQPREITAAGAQPAPVRLTITRPSAPAIMRNVTTQDLERALGRYGMLVLAGLAAVAAVGTFLSWAISHGYLVLGPAARVGIGVAAGAGIGAWGMVLRRRERSFGSSLVGLALVILLVCAYAAGPSFHLVPVPLAFGIVAAISALLAVFAHRESDEPLWCVGFGGAAATPFVTTNGRGNAYALVAYAVLLLTSASLAIGPRRWLMARRVFYVAAAILIFAAAIAASSAGHGAILAALAIPFIVAAVGVLPVTTKTYTRATLRWLAALTALMPLTATATTDAWTLGIGFTGVLAIWLVLLDGTATLPQSSLSGDLRDPVTLDWIDAAFLPLAFAVRALDALPLTHLAAVEAALAITIGAFAVRRAAGSLRDAAALSAVALAAAAVSALELPPPMWYVAGFVALALACVIMHGVRPSLSWLGAALAGFIFAAATSAMALLQRVPYRFTPFETRASAAAAIVLAGLVVLARGWRVVRRATRAAMWARPEWTYAHTAELLMRVLTIAPWIWAFVWILLELWMAFSPSTSTLLLVVYFAASGVGCVAAGRARHAPHIRQTGLALGIAAAATSFYGASTYFGIAARILAYLVTSAFLLGIAYWYRRPGSAPVAG